MAIASKFSTIEEALLELKAGKMIIVVDDEDRENEGDLISASELVTPEIVNFMSSKAKGLICVAITENRAKELELNEMVTNSSGLHGTKFTVSVDYMHNTTTGISANDRFLTIKSLCAEDTKPTDLGRPGHIFPLIAAKEGVLRRAGHTEAAVDLMRLAGLYPSGVLCEIIKNDGTMARRPDLEIFAKRHNLKMITVKDLIAFRLKTDFLVKEMVEANLPTSYGNFKLKVYANILDNKEHIAIVKGTWKEDDVVLVRVHSECLTGDVFHSMRCDCGDQLANSLKMLEKEGRGVLLYMRQEGRGIGLVNKIKAYNLQDDGYDTVEANLKLGFLPDPRDYGIGAQILTSLGIKKMKLITNNPTKRVGLESYGLEVVGMTPIEIEPNLINIKYLKTKKSKMGHLLTKI